jgi:hypothetical protein
MMSRSNWLPLKSIIVEPLEKVDRAYPLRVGSQTLRQNVFIRHPANQRVVQIPSPRNTLDQRFDACWFAKASTLIFGARPDLTWNGRLGRAAQTGVRVFTEGHEEIVKDLR